MMHTDNAGLRSLRYSGDVLDANCDDVSGLLEKSRSGSISPKSFERFFTVKAWTDQPERTNAEALMHRRNALSPPAMLKLALAILVPCASTLSLPAFGQSTNQTEDPAWRQSVERVIESYIRSHPEMIEQAQQALEAKRQEEEKVRVKEAIAMHQSELLHDPASPVSGDPAGEVTVVEFFDYRCGFCQRAAGSVTQLQKDDARVRIVYKDFPILGAASVQAAKAALASRSQDQHQAFHEALFAAKGDLMKEQILQIAKDVGLDTQKLVADMDNPEWVAIIERNRALASDLGITGTPAFVVGTELVPGAIDLTTLKDLVARARTR
ncbi:MAG: DsbA family protein [Nitrospira sp.]|nr:MAG: DsbA family protein [Nitrospira sp.]